MNISEANYLDTLDLIQEAALAPAAWDKVLRQLARLTNCIAGGLTVEDAHTRKGYPLTYFGFDQSHVEKAFAYYLPMNPLFKIAPLMKPGFIVANGDLIPNDAFRRTEFYDGWARPQGICCPVTLVLHRERDVYCPLTLVRPDGAGDVSSDDRALLRRLAPHLIRAMGVSMRLGLAQRQHSALESALSFLTIAVLLLDRRQHVIFANPAAEKLLASRTALTIVNHALAALDQRSQQELQKTLIEVLRQKAGAGAEISIRRERGPPLLAAIVPLAAENPFSTLLEGAACCAVFVTDPASAQAPRSSAFARAHGLTPSEGRLLDLILSGAGLQRAADGMGVSMSTAKTHLKHIFAKTGTGRQGELINIVMASPPPLLNRE